jgi:hypothetical protein
MWDVYSLYYVLLAVVIAISFKSFSRIWPRRPGITLFIPAHHAQIPSWIFDFFLDEESNMDDYQFALLSLFK